MHACLLSHVQLVVTPWTVAHQAALSMGFSRQEYWSGLACPPLGHRSCQLKESIIGTSLVVQWLLLHLPMQAVQVWCLLGELRSHMLCCSVCPKNLEENRILSSSKLQAFSCTWSLNLWPLASLHHILLFNHHFHQAALNEHLQYTSHQFNHSGNYKPTWNTVPPSKT